MIKTWLLYFVPRLYALAHGDAAVLLMQEAMRRLRDIDPECSKQLNTQLREVSSAHPSLRAQKRKIVYSPEG